MKNEKLKLLLDIESIINEIDEIKNQTNNDFIKFNPNFVLQRAVERELEIIGEAINKLSKLDSNIKISKRIKNCLIKEPHYSRILFCGTSIDLGNHPKGYSNFERGNRKTTNMS